MSKNPTLTPAPQQLLLLRHGEVESHCGDVPITEAGAHFAIQVGQTLGRTATAPVLVLTGETRRTRETAEAICAGATAAGGSLTGPRVAAALRNPDLYVAGQRVNMVSSLAALAAQLEGVDEQTASQVPFFRGFLQAEDRIGYWLAQENPPGDDPMTVARRIKAFAGSLTDLPQPGLTVAVTHSPVLRAVALAELGEDIGEPPWVGGLRLDITPDRTVSATLLDAVH